MTLGAHNRRGGAKSGRGARQNQQLLPRELGPSKRHHRQHWFFLAVGLPSSSRCLCGDKVTTSEAQMSRAGRPELRTSFCTEHLWGRVRNCKLFWNFFSSPSPCPRLSEVELILMVALLQEAAVQPAQAYVLAE